MSLAAGTRLGPYEIAAAIGSGGMGEVYRARDPRLDRDVAIKVLPASFAADPDRVRTALGIDDGTYLEVTEHEDEIRLRKLVASKPLGDDDPMWVLVGAADSGLGDVSADHDRHLATGEVSQWRGSS